jgi:uncharacterized protein YutE (UPF0331/DUF86 family)
MVMSGKVLEILQTLEEFVLELQRILLALGRHGIVPAELADRIQGMAGLRNILVHRYFKVDPEKVYQHLQQDLGDFAAFVRHVRDWMAAGH